MYKKEDKHATIAISVVQLCVQQAVVRSCLGWMLGQCLYPCQSHSIVKSRDRWRDWPTLCLSACPSTHHSPTTSTTTESLGKTTVLYNHFKKRLTEQTAANVTLWLWTFYLKPEPCFHIWCGSANQIIKEKKTDWTLTLHNITKTNEAGITKTHPFKQKDMSNTLQGRNLNYASTLHLNINRSYNHNLTVIIKFHDHGKSSPC